MEDCVLNEQIQPREEDVFPIILKMTQLIIKYDLSVDEIQFNTVSDIRLKTSNLTIKLGTSSELDAKIAELPAIIEALSGRKGTVNMENYQESNKMITFKDSSASH
jgi:cell division protein FtsQ